MIVIYSLHDLLLSLAKEWSKTRVGPARALDKVPSTPLLELARTTCMQGLLAESALVRCMVPLNALQVVPYYSRAAHIGCVQWHGTRLAPVLPFLRWVMWGKVMQMAT